MNQSVLILADFVPKKVKNPQTIDSQSIDLEKLFKQSQENKKEISYLVIDDKCELIFQKIKEKIKAIKAAGGLVKNGNGDYLFIYRLGKWDLPKGKVENNEKMREAAVREVEEECGIKIDYLGRKLLTSYHCYYMRGEFMLKTTNWYDMGINKSPELIPQKEEDITAAIWQDPSDLKAIKNNTYPIIKDILALV
ncbi:NUDIX domain-containing protein [Rhinopithecimicrobium faecis]